MPWRDGDLIFSGPGSPIGPVKEVLATEALANIRCYFTRQRREKLFSASGPGL